MKQRRPVFIALGLGMMLVSLPGVTHVANKMYRVACLWFDAPVRRDSTIAALRKTLHDSGYKERSRFRRNGCCAQMR